MRTLLLSALLVIVAGCGTPSLLITPVQNTSSLQEITVQPGKGWNPPKVALIEVEGMLINARTGGFMQPTENPLSLLTQQLEQAERDPDVKAVVLRINSPGGTVTTSDAMYQLVTRFRKRTQKPVVASCQEVTASGGYYVALASDRILAQPTSIVGSIGVIFNTFEFEGTMNKIGARAEAIKSGPLKDMGSPFKHLTPEERAVMQQMVDEFYARFVGVMKQHRAIRDEATVKLVTDGRVFSGERARELGLVDETGLLEDALASARKLAGVPNARTVMYKRPFGYRGSIYANAEPAAPQANVTKLELPVGLWLPTGFYYLWNP